MEYDTIKLLNLEDIDIDLSKSYIVKNDNVITCNITLNKTSYCCEYCGSVNTIIHEYSNKKITHSISTGYHCVINYKARRFKCKDCNSTFFEKNPFCMKDEKLSLYTDMKILEKLKSHTATFSSVSRDLNVSILLIKIHLLQITINKYICVAKKGSYEPFSMSINSTTQKFKYDKTTDIFKGVFFKTTSYFKSPKIESYRFYFNPILIHLALLPLPNGLIIFSSFNFNKALLIVDSET